MAKGELLSRIRSLYPSLTKAEKRVADFVLENPRSVLFLSITDLADACAVGDTSVFRFCRTLGVQGYQEFKMQLSLGMDDEDKAPECPEELLADAALSVLTKRVLKANVDALNETCALLSQESLSQAVELLLAAREICFFGVGSSMLTAMEAVNRFMRITSNVKCAPDSHLQAMMASLLTPEDAAVVFSYSGATKDALQSARLARRRGAGVIAVTRFAKSPLTACSDLVLLCGAQEGPLEGGSISAKVSQLYLLDLLYAAYFQRRQEISADNKRRTTEAVVDRLV